MERLRLIFIYSVFCLMTVHLTFVLSENDDRNDDDVTDPSLLNDDQNDVVTKPSISLLSSLLSDEDTKTQNLPDHSPGKPLNLHSDDSRSVQVPVSPSTTLNTDNSGNNPSLNNNTKPTAVVKNTELLDLLPLLLYSESAQNTKNKVFNNSVTSFVNKNAKLAPVTLEPQNENAVVEESENTSEPDDETTPTYNKVLGDSDENEEDDSTSKDSDAGKTDGDITDRSKSIRMNVSSGVLSLLKDLKHDHIDKHDLLDEENTDDDEDYDENEDSKVEKKHDETNIHGEIDDDDAHEDDDDDDKDYKDENDGDSDDDNDDFNEFRNDNAEEIELSKKIRLPTAPTSMVLFYTWIIVAVLIIIVGISTYQSRCRGLRFPWTKAASNPKDDHKRLIEHEFV